jgi:uncharacterized protein (DUF1501 family)
MSNETQIDQPTSRLTRRAFMQASSLMAGTAGSLLCETPEAIAGQTGRAQHCIVLCLVGGPSQLETWDPKPDAPADVRGPFGSIATSVPGVRISEHLPRLASLAHRYTLLRTVHHSAAPVHEAGLQLLQTGTLGRGAVEYPHFGAVLAQQRGPRQRGAIPFVILPWHIGNTGINVGHGQGAGALGAAYEPQVQTSFTAQLPASDRERYGKTWFGDACLQAVRLVEQGTRCVVVNMFDTLYDRVTWDCHADRHSLSSTLTDYRRTLCPTLDHAAAALLDDLQQRGLFDQTVVVVMGELGRTPRLNANGGRDHWTGCWSILMAGGGVPGGQVIGASDRLAAEPAQRPIACAEVTASVYRLLGLSLPGHLSAAPIRELGL